MFLRFQIDLRGSKALSNTLILKFCLLSFLIKFRISDSKFYKSVVYTNSMNIKFNFFPYFFFFLILHIREKIESHWSKLFKASAGETEKWGRKSDSPVSCERNKKGKRKKNPRANTEDFSASL